MPQGYFPPNVSYDQPIKQVTPRNIKSNLQISKRPHQSDKDPRLPTRPKDNTLQGDIETGLPTKTSAESSPLTPTIILINTTNTFS